MTEHEDDYDDRDERDDERIIAEAKEKVRIPAIGMIVLAIITLLTVPVNTLVLFMLPQILQQQRDQVDQNPNMPADQKKQMKDILTVYEEILPKTLPFGIVLNLIVGIVCLIGSVKMLRLSSRGWGLTASILNIASIGQGCCCLSLPVGIWAIMVLSNPKVQAGFAAVARQRASGGQDVGRDRDQDRY
ncbi:MAG: hypothetical protein L0241_21625 [Planctomycetia bacterium]|nr:hypothetical protein [Planctomycetia bacterium]